LFETSRFNLWSGLTHLNLHVVVIFGDGLGGLVIVAFG